jgi:Na+-transporting NADH:ubiquinone oxidoreductase subunit F
MRKGNRSHFVADLMGGKASRDASDRQNGRPGTSGSFANVSEWRGFPSQNKTMAKKEIIRTTITKIQQLSSDVRHFEIQFPDDKWIDFKAGQFILIHMPHEGKIVPKPYSIASPPHERGQMDLCIKRIEGGLVSPWFFTLKEGDPLDVSGAFGHFLVREGDAIFAGTGTGIAPLRAMIKDVFKNGFHNDCWLIFGNRYETDVLYKEEFEGLAKLHPNFHFIPVISRPHQWTGEKGYIQDVFHKYVNGPENKKVYICGIVPMVVSLEQSLLKEGWPKTSVFYEKYT